MSTLVQTVFNVPTLSGQVAGTNTIQLTATLSAASAETVGYMNEARAYIDSIDASISQRYQDIRLFNDAIMSTDNTFLDSNSESRMTWRAMENFASASNWLTLQNTVTSHAELLNDIELNRTALNNSVSTLTTANGLQNTRLDALEATIAPYADDLATLNGEIAGHSTTLSSLQLFDNWVNSELTTLGLQIESQEIRITNTENTYASQNVLIQSLLDQGTAHDARLELVEASTSIEVQTARFNAIDLAVASNSAELTAHQEAQAVLDANQDQAILANTQAINTETTDRTAADTALNNQINTINTALNTETSNRSAADTALGNQITTLESNLLADIATRALRDGPETYTGEKTFLMGANEVLTVSGTVNFGGDVNIAGSLNTVNATQVDIDDSVINLNAGETGTPSQNAGIVVERGTAVNAQLQWNEATDRWQAGLTGTLENIILQSAFDAADSSNVKLTGNQTISGNKTLPGITRMDSARIDNLDIDSAAFIFTNAPLRYSAAAIPKILNVNELINKGYVDDGLAEKLDLTGGFMSGNLTIDAPSAAVVLNSDTGTHAQIAFRENNVVKGFVYHDYVNDMMRIQRRNGTVTTNEIQIRDTFTAVDEDLRVNFPGDRFDSVQTKQQIQDNFLSLNGGTLTSNLTVNNSNGGGSVTAAVQIESDNDAGWAGVDLLNKGTRGGLLYRNGIGTTPGVDNGTLRLRRYDMITNAVTSELILGNNIASLNCRLSVIDSTATNSATSRGYVDSTFLPLAGGTLSGSIVLDDPTLNNRQLRFNNTGAAGQAQGHILFYENGSLDSQIYSNASSLVLHKNSNSNIVIGSSGSQINGDLKVSDAKSILTLSSTAGNSEIRLENDGTLVGQQYIVSGGINDRFVVLKRDNSAIGGTQANALAIYGDHATLTHSTTTSHPDTALTTKDWVDAGLTGKLNLTGGALTGGLDFTETVNTNRRIRFINTGTQSQAAGSIDFFNDAGLFGQFYSSPGSTVLSRSNSTNTFTQTDTRTIVNSALEATADVTTTPSIIVNNKNASSTFGAINFNDNGVTHSQIFANGDSRMTITRTGGAGLNIFNDHISVGGFTQRLVLPTTQDLGATSAVHRQHVQDTTVQQPSAYSIVMPSALPIVGQQLQVVAVSGSTVTMGWV